jgi:hypothetical protein
MRNKELLHQKKKNDKYQFNSLESFLSRSMNVDPSYLPPECVTCKPLGKFQCDNGKLFVTDPCYSRETIETGRIGVTLDAVKTGVWWAVFRNSVTYPERVAELSIIHESIYPPTEPLKLDKYEQDGWWGLGVDTGQAGFFAQKHYPEGDVTGDYDDRSTFYGMCCFITCDTPNRAGIIASSPTTGCGVVSSSGWGDGLYDLYLSKDDDGNVCAARIDFLVDEREELMIKIGLVPAPQLPDDVDESE